MKGFEKPANKTAGEISARSSPAEGMLAAVKAHGTVEHPVTAAHENVRLSLCSDFLQGIDICHLSLTTRDR